jgi:hypothetical protein
MFDHRDRREIPIKCLKCFFVSNFWTLIGSFSRAKTSKYSTSSSENAGNMSLKSRSINWLPPHRPAPSCEDFHHLQPADGRRYCRKIVVNGLLVSRSKQPGRIAIAIGRFALFHADDSVRKTPR